MFYVAELGAAVAIKRHGSMAQHYSSSCPRIFFFFQVVVFLFLSYFFSCRPVRLAVKNIPSYFLYLEFYDDGCMYVLSSHKLSLKPQRPWSLIKTEDSARGYRHERYVKNVCVAPGNTMILKCPQT